VSDSIKAADKELNRIRERLGDYYTDQEVEIWLESPQPLLGGEVAADVIMRGDHALVDDILDRLDAGAYL